MFMVVRLVVVVVVVVITTATTAAAATFFEFDAVTGQRGVGLLAVGVDASAQSLHIVEPMSRQVGHGIQAALSGVVIHDDGLGLVPIPQNFVQKLLRGLARPGNEHGFVFFKGADIQQLGLVSGMQGGVELFGFHKKRHVFLMAFFDVGNHFLHRDILVPRAQLGDRLLGTEGAGAATAQMIAGKKRAARSWESGQDIAHAGVGSEGLGSGQRGSHGGNISLLAQLASPVAVRVSRRHRISSSKRGLILLPGKPDYGSPAGSMISHDARSGLTPEPSSTRPGLWFLLLGAISLFYFVLGTWNNDFHYLQHPDEPSKVEQVMTGARNLHHPLLMLNTVALAARVEAAFLPKRFESRHWLGKRLTPQDCARLGRFISAGFVALGIFCASAALLVAGHRWAALFAASFLSINQTMIWVGHFFKEDAAFIFGLGIYLLAAAWLMKGPSRRRFIALGVAAALLLSAKWAGALCLAGHFLGMAAFRDTRPLFRGLGWAALGFSVVFALVNHQLLASLGTAQNSLDREFVRLAGGREPAGVVSSYWFWFLDLMRYEPGSWVVGATVGGLACGLRRRLGSSTRLAVFLLAAYVFSLGFTPIPSQRYFVPAAFAVLWLAGIAVGYAIERWRDIPWRSVRLSVAAALVVYIGVCVLLAGQRSGRALAHFKGESVVEAWHWVRQNLADKPAVMAQIGRQCLPGQARLPDPGTEPLPVSVQRIDTRTLSYDDLKNAGITHLIFRSVDRSKSLRGRGADETFFADLETRGERVFQALPGEVHIIQPGIEIYEIH